MERVRDVIAQNRAQRQPRALSRTRRRRDLRRRPVRRARRLRGRRPHADRRRRSCIATGSRPAVPPIPGLDAVPYLTNETVFDLREPVPSLLVVGSGPIGSELAQAFRRLGSEVTVVDIAPRILPREDADLAQVVHAADARRRHPLSLRRDDPARRRRATAPSRVTIKGKDGAEKTLRRHAPAAGGRPPAQHRRAGPRRRGRARGQRPDRRRRPAAHDQPAHLRRRRRRRRLPVHAPRRASRRDRAAPRDLQALSGRSRRGRAVVHVHRSGARARRPVRNRSAGDAHRAPRLSFPVRRHRPRARRRRDGGLREARHRPEGKLLGAAIVGPHAGELIAECVLALSQGMKAKDMSAAIHTYPTLASVNRRVADQRLKEGLTPSAKALDQAHLRPARARDDGGRCRVSPHRNARAWIGVVLLAVFVGAVVAFFAFGGQHYLSLDTIKANRDALLAFTRAHYAAGARDRVPRLRGATVAFSLPGGLVLSLTMGFIFGRWVGTVLVVVAATVGATHRLSRRALHLRRRRAQAAGRARRADQRGLHRKRVQLHAVPAPGPGVSVFPRQPRARVHVDSAAHVRAGDVHRHHPGHVRVREPGRDAWRASTRSQGLVSVADARRVRAARDFSRCCPWRGSAATPRARPMGEPPPMRLSIVIPALDEAHGIVAMLAALQPLRAAGHEVIVVDGGSCGRHARSGARRWSIAPSSRRAGRARQMNAGAGIARQATCCCSCMPTPCCPPDAADAIVRALRRQSPLGTLRRDHRAAAPAILKLVAFMMNLRSRLTGIATGDQGIFVDRSLFADVGGYPDIPLMEDVALSKVLKRRGGRPACLEHAHRDVGAAMGAARTVAHDRQHVAAATRLCARRRPGNAGAPL